MIEYLQQPIGQGVSEVKSVSVTNTAADVLQKAARKMCYFRNTSTGGQVITLTFSDTDVAVAGTGIVLNVGEYIIDSDSENYKCWQGKVSAIASAVGGSLAVMQRA